MAVLKISKIDAYAEPLILEIDNNFFELKTNTKNVLKILEIYQNYQQTPQENEAILKLILGDENFNKLIEITQDYHHSQMTDVFVKILEFWTTNMFNQPNGETKKKIQSP